MIQQKAKLAREESSASQKYQLSDSEEEAPLLVGVIEVAGKVPSCDSSLNSSAGAGLMNGHVTTVNVSATVVSKILHMFKFAVIKFG